MSLHVSNCQQADGDMPTTVFWLQKIVPCWGHSSWAVFNSSVVFPLLSKNAVVQILIKRIKNHLDPTVLGNFRSIVKLYFISTMLDKVV